MVRVVMDIFINQNASKLFIDFLLCVLLKSGTRGFFVIARVCSYCAGVNIGSHTRPDPITKRISVVPPSKWRDVSHICRAETHSTYCFSFSFSFSGVKPGVRNLP